jgi:Mg/Co/Ni transporter MgtE
MDNEHIAETLGAAFEHFGWTVLAFLDSQGAVKIVTSIHPDKVADLLEHLAAHVRNDELDVIRVRNRPRPPVQH